MRGIQALIVAAIMLTPALACATEPPCLVHVTHHIYSGLPNDPDGDIDNFDAKMELQRIFAGFSVHAEKVDDYVFGLGSWTIRDKYGCIIHPAVQSIDVSKNHIKVTPEQGDAYYLADGGLKVDAWLQKYGPQKKTEKD